MLGFLGGHVQQHSGHDLAVRNHLHDWNGSHHLLLGGGRGGVHRKAGCASVSTHVSTASAFRVHALVMVHAVHVKFFRVFLTRVFLTRL